MTAARNRDELKQAIHDMARRAPQGAYRGAGYTGDLRRKGNNLVGLCCFHEECTPSLHITVEGDYAGMFKCFGCDARGDLFSFYQRYHDCDFGEAVAGLQQALGIAPPSPRSKSAPEVARTVYKIRGVSGALIAEHVRIDRADGVKSLFWRRDGKSGLAGLRTPDLPLYRAELLTAAPAGTTVVLAEGEKATDALTAHGILALGTVTGAGSTPSNETLRPLAAFAVVLWPDRDSEGEAHMQRIGDRLLALGCRSVRMVDWPDAPLHGDAADFDGDVSELVGAAKPYEPRVEYHWSDLGNARRLAARYGDDLRYSYPARCWYVWDGRRWARDTTGQADALAKETSTAAYAELADLDEDTAERFVRFLTRSEGERGRRDMLASAQSEPGIPILPEDLDTDPQSLTVLNGTIDLGNGDLRPHRREDLITRLAPVTGDPDADCPRWRSFLDRVLGSDPELIEFVRRAVGYSLTGDTTEQVFFLLHGTGANGKSTFLRVLETLLGEYAHRASFETFLLQRISGGPRNDIAALAGVRLAVAVEADAGRRLAEVTLKELTGGDTVRARFLYQEGFEFRPAFKLWLACNHRPDIRGTDHAIWRRIRLIPFTVTIPPDEQDKDLEGKLTAELSGILNWALAGLRDWRINGLGNAAAVTAATAAYRDEQDVLAAFLGDACVVQPAAEAAAADLFRAYQAWCDAAGEKPGSQTTFGRRLAERGFRREKRSGRIWWCGLGLLDVGFKDSRDS